MPIYVNLLNYALGKEEIDAGKKFVYFSAIAEAQFAKLVNLADTVAVENWVNANLKNYIFTKYADENGITSTKIYPYKEEVSKDWPIEWNRSLDNPRFRQYNPDVALYRIKALSEKDMERFSDWVEYLNFTRIPDLSSLSPEDIDSYRYKSNGTEVVKWLEDGYHWSQLLTDAACIYEGEVMNNCIGDMHLDDVVSGYEKIYSLRDSYENPHLDIAIVQNTGEIIEIKGNSNNPVKDEYIPFLLEFLNTPIASFKSIKYSELEYNNLMYSDGKYSVFNVDFTEQWVKKNCKKFKGFYAVPFGKNSAVYLVPNNIISSLIGETFLGVIWFKHELNRANMYMYLSPSDGDNVYTIPEEAIRDSIVFKKYLVEFLNSTNSILNSESERLMNLIRSGGKYVVFSENEMKKYFKKFIVKKYSSGLYWLTNDKSHNNDPYTGFYLLKLKADDSKLFTTSSSNEVVVTTNRMSDSILREKSLIYVTVDNNDNFYVDGYENIDDTLISCLKDLFNKIFPSILEKSYFDKNPFRFIQFRLVEVEPGVFLELKKVPASFFVEHMEDLRSGLEYSLSTVPNLFYTVVNRKLFIVVNDHTAEQMQSNNKSFNQLKDSIELCFSNYFGHTYPYTFIILSQDFEETIAFWGRPRLKSQYNNGYLVSVNKKYDKIIVKVLSNLLKQTDNEEIKFLTKNIMEVKIGSLKGCNIVDSGKSFQRDSISSTAWKLVDLNNIGK